MQFGMPTLIEVKSSEVCAALCNELGLAFIELNMNLPEYQADELDVNHLREVAEEYKIAAHTNLHTSQTALNILTHIGVVERVGKQGNLYIYTRV